MAVDFTDPYALRDWLRDQYQRVGFYDDFLAATKGLRAASEAQLEEFTAQGLEDIVDLVAGMVKGRGRSRERMRRVVVVWCLAEGWRPDDPGIAEAAGDVFIWLLQAGRDASPDVIQRLSLDVARARRELTDGTTTFSCWPDLRRQALEKLPDFFEVKDDTGLRWRIWCLEHQGLALLKLPAGSRLSPCVDSYAYTCRLMHNTSDGTQGCDDD